MKSLFSDNLRASDSEEGSFSSLESSSSLAVNKLMSVFFGRGSFFSIPYRLAYIKRENARYGLVVGSADRSSMRR